MNRLLLLCYAWSGSIFAARPDTSQNDAFAYNSNGSGEFIMIGTMAVITWWLNIFGFNWKLVAGGFACFAIGIDMLNQPEDLYWLLYLVGVGCWYLAWRQKAATDSLQN